MDGSMEVLPIIVTRPDGAGSTFPEQTYIEGEVRGTCCDSTVMGEVREVNNPNFHAGPNTLFL